MRVYHLLIAIILLAISPFVFKLVFPKKQQSPQQPAIPEPTTSLVKTSPTLAKLPAGNTWKYLLGKTTTPPGWKVRACDGDLPLLCVFSAQNQQLGQIELQIHGLSEEKNFQKMLLIAGIPTGFNLDYQDQTYQPQIINALNAWVAENYTNQSQYQDKQIPTNIPIFAAYPTQKVMVGNLPGIRYGFAKMNADGGIREQKLGYVAFDGNLLYNISTKFDRTLAPNNLMHKGKFDRLESLAVFTPYLDAIASELKLP